MFSGEKAKGKPMPRALKTTYCRCHTAYSSRVAPLRCPFCFSRTEANIKDIFLSCKSLINRKLNRIRQKWGAQCDGSCYLPSHQTSEKWGISFFRKLGKINLLFTQDLMDLANKLGIRLLIVHYPPYCSKFNPIEHRLFSQITRSWNGAPLLNLQNAAERAMMTTTKKGLKVHVHINFKTYDIKRPIEESYPKRLASQVVFALELGKWNYLIKPAN